MTGIKSEREPAVSTAAMMKTLALLSAALMLLLLPGTLTQESQVAPIDVVVENSLLGSAPATFSTHVVYRGILLGALKRLMASNGDFKFTYTEDLNYGPYLESVNGLAGNDKERTYWELLVKTPDGIIKRPDVGIGCYIPSANEQIILRFSKW
ncbi:transcobalamin-1-like [Notolabrus celidotus]|uniref:transcobalamin-1-like n=1 Tax=Notolabrus celidotus TaxID=1203425 RepID=UPI00148F6CD9|nr:transcobalamin-1-like [Notolabrus celidotus]XP_034556212.1 transcobalamin-1-like [Notolabrus celidotus]XP_034556213.1 transcobalamin-1-like [Notolabrus celidotus]XP_034556214.1 transcobalamin-1-like [Notolabrus celidotus]XP_034556215.1 transcobalamin-1-like [Notolabrus celidotus]XP_034556216.1 transcobalamin-1-like [Notolabrus celidotus]XP_034556217.1 transcobalamin-1-like [Notolabrus celidotus]XP_034556218.1 transcobalamin-1-like [Notolabrus celidotus]XP_034556219.1 transcobalamin-1-lik